MKTEDILNYRETLEDMAVELTRAGEYGAAMDVLQAAADLNAIYRKL